MDNRKIDLFENTKTKSQSVVKVDKEAMQIINKLAIRTQLSFKRIVSQIIIQAFEKDLIEWRE